jgi:hypothetical protein
MFPCGLPYSNASNCGSVISIISDPTRNCKLKLTKGSNYIDFSNLYFDYFSVPENNLEEYSIDLWFYSEWQSIPNVTYTLRWENHLVISILPTIRFMIFCNPNDQTFDYSPWYTNAFIDKNQSSWHYYRCSVSLIRLKLLQILDDSSTYYNGKFVVPRNITEFQFSNLNFSSSIYPNQNKNFLLRNIRLFNTFFSESVDLKYK